LQGVTIGQLEETVTVSRLRSVRDQVHFAINPREGLSEINTKSTRFRERETEWPDRLDSGCEYVDSRSTGVCGFQTICQSAMGRNLMEVVSISLRFCRVECCHRRRAEVEDGIDLRAPHPVRPVLPLIGAGSNSERVTRLPPDVGQFQNKSPLSIRTLILISWTIRWADPP
jgi:hypothetical protein